MCCGWKCFSSSNEWKPSPWRFSVTSVTWRGLWWICCQTGDALQTHRAQTCLSVLSKYHSQISCTASCRSCQHCNQKLDVSVHVTDDPFAATIAHPPPHALSVSEHLLRLRAFWRFRVSSLTCILSRKWQINCPEGSFSFLSQTSSHTLLTGFPLSVCAHLQHPSLISKVVEVASNKAVFHITELNLKCW